MATVKVEGLDSAFRGLDRASVTRALGLAVSVTAKQVRNRMATYPPETEANRPKPYPGQWYQRLWGQRRALAGGGVGGRNTSEQLQYSWRRRIVSPLTQHVQTPVSYASLVQGANDQTDVHRQHGWHTDEQIADEVCTDPRVDAEIMAVFDKMLR